MSLVNYGLASQSCAADRVGGTCAILHTADILAFGIALGALCGIVTSLGFAVGILFAFLPTLLVSTC